MVIILIVSIYGVLLFVSEADELLASLSSFGLGFVLFLLVVSSLNFVLRFVRWHFYLTKIGVSLPLLESFVVFLSGFSMAITPGKAGEVIKSMLIRTSHGVPVSQTLPVIVTERVSDLSGLLFLMAIGISVLPNGWAYAALLLFGIAVLQLACASETVGRFFIRLAGRVPVVKRFLPTIETLYSLFHSLADIRTYAIAFVLSVLAWGAQCLLLYLAVDYLPDTDLSPAESMFIYAGPLVAGNLASLPGGLGLTEGSMAGLLARLGGPGMTLTAAIALTLVVRGLTLWWALIVGYIALFYWRFRYDTSRASTSADGE